MRVLVTGAGAGVGRATSALLAARGHEVIATARDLGTLDDLDVAGRLHLDVTDAMSIGAVHRELYSATKHALEAISEALHVELAHFGVRVVIIEPGFIAPGMKVYGPVEAPAAYDELEAQLAQVAGKMQGGARPGPDVVAKAIADAIDNDDGPLRRRVGDDANLILSARSTLGDEEFETAMREVAGLTW
jgi:NAD(P)-dependent dehydrogenase (short-subunit alcohol dehydrogenase family)